MKSIVFTFCLLFLVPCLLAQTAEEWLEQAEEATATAQTAENEGRDVDAQNAYREAATARANAAEKQVEAGKYKEAAQNYEQAAEDFDKAGNDAQADSERIKAKSNYQNAADQAAVSGNSDLAEELGTKAMKVSEDLGSKIALTIVPKGTGQTTGHILTITATNTGSNPVQLVATGKSGLDAIAFVDTDINEASNIFGLKGKYENEKIDLESSMAYIPSDGKHQSYVATESSWPPGIAEGSGTPNEHGQTPIGSIGPGESVVIPVQGYCADIRQPPVPSGVESSPVSNWVTPEDATFPGPGELQQHGIQIIEAPADGGPYLANIPAGIDPGADQSIALSNKTDPEVTAAFLFDAISRISVTTDILQEAGMIATPFSSTPDEEREAIIQQTLWLYSSVLTNDTYTKEEFSERMTTQYEENTGTKIKNAAPEVQERLEGGVEDFWNSFNLVGSSAKVIKSDKDAELQNTLSSETKEKLDGAVGDVSSETSNTADLEDIEDKEDFDVWQRKKYDDYTVERAINGKSHEKACKSIGVDPDSELGEALKRVYTKEKS